MKRPGKPRGQYYLSPADPGAGDGGQGKPGRPLCGH